jgi:secondary thiamine-phosphate synthase enzyme
METISIQTSKREELLDITRAVQSLVASKGWAEGMLLLWCPHTTGALTVNENADPDVARDIVVNMNSLVPPSGDYRHAEGNSDAHIKTSLFGPGLTLIVSEGRVQLGTWQGIYFCEWDGPQTRKLWLQFVKSD